MPEIHRPNVPKSKRARLIASVAIVAVAVALGVEAYRLLHAPVAAPAMVPPGIPVQSAVAAESDVPIYFDGLGTVQAFKTITVTTRVDGELQTVNFVEGQDVKAGDVLAHIDPRLYQAAYDQAVATKAKDEAQLANAKLDLQRYATLVTQNYTSQQIFETQKALVAQLEAQVKMDQALIDSAKTNLDYTTIRSPIEGRTGFRLVDPGNNVLTAANTGIAVLTQMHPISVVFTLPADDLPAFRKAAAKEPPVVIALSRDLKTELDRGTVAVLDNEILQTTGTIRLKATFPNAKETLWPGEYVNARVMIETKHNVVTIPSTAVQRGPDGLFTYVISRDSTVEVRPLDLDQFDGGEAIINKGVQPGEQVVATGQYRLQRGARVQVSNSRVTSAAPAETSFPSRAQ